MAPNIENAWENARQIRKLQKRLNAVLDLFTYPLTEKVEDNEERIGTIPSYWPKCPKCKQTYYVDHCIFEPKFLLCSECNTHFIGDKIV